MPFGINVGCYSPQKLFSFITDVATAENNCEEQHPNESKTQDKQLATNPEAESSSGKFKPEDRELADLSSQSSFASVDGTGKYRHHFNCFLQNGFSFISILDIF